MAASAKSRMEKLRKWRKQTGRTPMKRLSYVMECASHPNLSNHTPSLPITTPTTRIPVSSLGPDLSTSHHPPLPPSSRRITRKSLPNKKNENCCPVSVRRERVQNRGVNTNVPRTKELKTRGELAQLRRKMLEEWKEKNGRKLKRPPLFLRQVYSPEKKPSRPQKRRHTIGVLREGGGRGGGGGWRDQLKQQLQQEIEDDYIMEEEKEQTKEEQREVLISQNTPRRQRGADRNEEENKENSGGSFKSRKVKFMLSEPRRRRSCFAAPPTTPMSRTLYLTPVRRSTREGRNHDGPGMKLDAERCFDSPSDVNKQLNFDELQIITNNLLN